MAVLTAMICIPTAVHGGSDSDGAANSRAAYNSKIAASYNYHFGPTQPFLPSNATTDTGAFIDPKEFPTAEYCGHCHQETQKQWRQSAHSELVSQIWTGV